MTKMMRSILKQALCILLILNTQVKAFSDAQPDLDSDLDTRATLTRLRLLLEYSEVRTAAEFVEKFASQRPAEEKKEFLKRISPLKTLPKLEAIENGIMLSQDSETIKIDMRFMDKRRFLVNGQAFTPSPNHSWIVQGDILLDLLQHPRKTHSSMFYLLVPQAHAFGPLLTAVAFVGLALVNVAIPHYGNDALEALDWSACDEMKRRGKGQLPANPKICKDYRIEVAKLNQADPRNNAASDLLLSKTSETEDYKTGEEVCPFQTKDQHYDGIVVIAPNEKSLQQVKGSKSQGSKTSDSTLIVRVYAQLDGEKLKNASVYHDEYVNGEYKPSPVAKYELDDKSILKAISLPDTSKAGEASGGKHKKEVPRLSIKIDAAADLKDDPKMQADQDRYKGLFKHLVKRLLICKDKSEGKAAIKIAPASGAGKTKIEHSHGTSGNTGKW